ncbi:helix-turn-helix transcriptional regulator [Chloroflexota bacterium]|nr:helix-turn-helix transcriptional regulator [Chloroflexota bacterium]
MASVLVFNEPDAFRVLDVDAPPERIVRAVNQGRWEEYLPGEHGPLFAHQQGSIVVVTHSEAEPKADLPKLSPREQQVLVLLGEGMTTAQIAIALGLSPRTIRGYVANMKARLEAQNIQQLVARAVALGLFRPEV